MLAQYEGRIQNIKEM